MQKIVEAEREKKNIKEKEEKDLRGKPSSLKQKKKCCFDLFVLTHVNDKRIGYIRVRIEDQQSIRNAYLQSRSFIETNAKKEKSNRKRYRRQRDERTTNKQPQHNSTL